MASEFKIRVAIVDDEAHARLRLRQLLKDQPDVELVAECANGRQALEALKKEKLDLVFLDVQMPRLSGLEVCQAAAQGNAPLPQVIFVTAHDEYALQAFEFHALDYLLKPFDRARFLKALDRARDFCRREQTPATDPRLAALLEELRPAARRPDRFVFKENGRLIFIRTETIDWIEADGNYVRLHVGNEAHFIRETLGGLEARLAGDKFMRISRSAIVNLDRVKEMQPLFYGDYTVLLHGGARLNLSRHYRDRLEAFLGRR
jgi:two-component system, LytTR family, response regulator